MVIVLFSAARVKATRYFSAARGLQSPAFTWNFRCGMDAFLPPKLNAEGVSSINGWLHESKKP